MNVHSWIKLAAVGTMIALTVVAVRRDHKHPPLVVMKVSEIIVTRVEAQEVSEDAPQKSSACPFEYLSQRRLADCHRKVIVEHEHEREKPKVMSAWSLPWSCTKVRWAANTFSKATLESMRVMNGVAPLTAAQKQQAKECIEGKRQ